MSNSPDKPVNFSHLGRPFQEKIVQALLLDRPWASQISEVIDTNYFEYGYLKLLANKYIEYHKKYKEFPSFDIIPTIIKEDLKNASDTVLKDQILEFLKKVRRNEDLNDLAYVKEKTLDFCKKQGLKAALERSVDLIHSDKYETIVDELKRAITLGTAHTPGHDLGNDKDIDARYSETYRRTIPTGIPELDQRKIMNGGSGCGELNIVIAPTGVGKSHVLVHIGAQALLKGKNVLHFTFELREKLIGIRYDSHLLDIDSLDCFEHKQEIKDFYKDNAATLGRLHIKEYPTGTVTVNTIRTYIEKVAIEGFRPDMIIIDYAGIMRSTEKYELPRLELKKIYEELRAFAIETDVPVWSACQSNRDGASNDIIDLHNMAEAYAQAHICDFVIGLARKPEEKATGYGNLFIAKNRAGVDGIQYRCHLDTARSKLRILTDQELEKLESDESLQVEEEKNNIRRKFSEIQSRRVGANSNIKLK